MTGPVLLIAAESRALRRQLGALAWTALEHLALAAHLDELGWAAPVGVRDVAAGLGVTKDTAARAIATVSAAGLVTFNRVETLDGRRRSGYRLHLPEGLQLRPSPDDQDTAITEVCRRHDAQDEHGPDPAAGTGVPPIKTTYGPPEQTRQAQAIGAPRSATLGPEQESTPHPKVRRSRAFSLYPPQPRVRRCDEPGIKEASQRAGRLREDPVA